MKSSSTGDRVLSSTANGIFLPVCPAPGSDLAGNAPGSSRTRGAGSADQATATVSTSFCTASGSPSAVIWVSMRGSAVRKCMPSLVRPRPGEDSGTFIAILRSISDS